MDLLTALSNKSDYSKTQLQLIVGAWVMSAMVEPKQKIDLKNGDVSEDDYDKTSIYSLLYALYRSMGTVRSGNGEPYEFTFNTWGYTWPAAWGAPPVSASDPQLMGKNAYAGLYHFDRRAGIHQGPRRQGAHRRDGLRHGRGRAPDLLEDSPQLHLRSGGHAAGGHQLLQAQVRA